MYRKILTLVTGAMGGQALAFAALPIISRLYQPEQLGTFQVMLAFCNTLGIVTALSLERVLLLDIGPRHTAAMRQLARRTVWAVSLLSVPLYLGFAQLVPAAPLAIAGVPVVVFVLATILFRGLFLVDYTDAIAADRLRPASLSIFFKDLARVAARIVLGLTALNPVGLFVAGAVDWVAGTAVLRQRVRIAGRSHRQARPLTRLRAWALLRRHRRFPIFYAPAAALTVLNSQTPVLLLGSAFPVREAGLYALAFLLLDRPSRIVAKASGDVLTHRMARSSDATSRRAVVQKAFILTGLNLLALLGIATLTWALAETVLGPVWSDTGRLAFACIPHALALFVSDLSIGMFAAVSRTAAGLARQLITLGVLCASFGLAYAAGLPVAMTVLAAGLGHLAVQLGFLVHFASTFRREAPGSGDNT